MTITFEVKGMKELGDKLAQFAPKLARRGLTRFVHAGAVVLRTRAREKAAAIGLRDDGTLIRSISIKKLKVPNWQTTAVYGAYHASGPYKRKAAKTGRKSRAPYGMWYERGFKNPSGLRVQRPHLRPALDENVQEIVEAMRKRMAEEIEKLEA
jgi:hypothetical protein